MGGFAATAAPVIRTQLAKQAEIIHISPIIWFRQIIILRRVNQLGYETSTNLSASLCEGMNGRNWRGALGGFWSNPTVRGAHGSNPGNAPTRQLA